MKGFLRERFIRKDTCPLTTFLILLSLIVFVSNLCAGGVLKWTFTTDAAIYSSPVYFSKTDRLYVANDGGRLYKLALMDTTKAYNDGEWGIGEKIANTPLVITLGSRNVAFIGTYDAFYCVHADSMKTIWKNTDAGNAYVMGQPAYCSSFGVVIAGNYDGAIYAFKVADGTKAWSFSTSGAHNNNAGICEGNNCYFGSGDKKLHCINCQDGSEEWSYKTLGGIWDIPVIDQAYLYFADDTGRIYKLKTADGTLIQNYDLPSGEAIKSYLVLFNSNLYLTSTNSIWCFDLNLTKKWSTTSIGSAVENSPYVTADLTYYTSYGCFVGLNTADGTENWVLKAGEQYVGDPIIVNNLIINGNLDKNVYAVTAGNKDGFKDGSGYKSGNIPSVLQAFPNPFTTKLSLSLPSSASIYSLTGQLIKTLPQGKQELDTTGWKAGVYLIKCDKETKRLVKLN